MADADGVSKRARYIEPGTEATDVRETAAKSIRPGDMLWIADGTVLADNRNQLIALLNPKSGLLATVAIREGRTGRTSEPPHEGAGIVIDAYSRWSSVNKVFGAMTAADAGAIGGKSAARRRKKSRLPKVEAGQMWKDPAYWHLDKWQITDKINARGRELGFKGEWSPSSLYREFKSRGMPAGPKIKTEEAPKPKRKTKPKRKR